METYKQKLNVNPIIQYNSCLNRGSLSFFVNPEVGPWQIDVLKSLINLLENKIEVLMYYGENDFYFNQIGGLDLISSLKWSGTKEFHKKALNNLQDQNGNIIAKMKQYNNLKF